MKKLLSLLVVIVTAANINALAQVTIVKKDSLSDNSKKIIESSENNIFNDPRTPRFIITDHSQKFLFGIGGFVAARGYYDFTGFNSNGGYADRLETPFNPHLPDQLGLSSATSLLAFKLLGDTKLGIIEANFETDFDTENSNLHLRKAYIRVGGFLVGQDWSVTTDMISFPTVIDAADPVAKIGYRIPMIRYGINIGDRWEIYSSLEFPTLTYSVNQQSFPLSERRPDFNNKFVYKAKSGVYNGQAVVMLRYLKTVVDPDMTQVVPNSGFCYGVSTSHQININKSSIYLNGMFGLGISDYIAGLSSHQMNVIPHLDYNNQAVDFLPVWAYGAVAAYTHRWSKKSNTSLVASYLGVSDQNIDNRGTINQNTIEKLYSLSANYLTELIPNLTIGGELYFSHKKVFKGDTAHGLRAVAMIRYNF